MENGIGRFGDLKETLEYIKEHYPDHTAHIVSNVEALVEQMQNDLLAIRHIHDSAQANIVGKFDNALGGLSQQRIPIQKHSNILHTLACTMQTKTLPEPTIATNAPIPHTLDEDFTFKKPFMIEIEGNQLKADSWVGVLNVACSYLFKKNSHIFMQFPSDPDMQGKSRVWFSTNPINMVKPSRVQGSNIWVMGNINANYVGTIIETMLNRYNIPLNCCHVYWEDRVASPAENTLDKQQQHQKSEKVPDTVYFDGKINGFHLSTKIATDIFKYISAEYRKSKCIDSRKMQDRFANTTDYKQTSYLVNQILTRLRNYGVIDLCNGSKKKYYRVVDQNKLSELIANPKMLANNPTTEIEDIAVYVIDKRAKKRCSNCSTPLVPYRLKYHVYTDGHRNTIEYDKEIQVKKCPNCNRLYMTEGTYNTLLRQQGNYIGRTNLRFIK